MMNQEMLAEAFRYPFKQKDWPTKLLIAYGLQLFAWLLIPAIPLYGYFYRLTQNIVNTGQDQLPPWDDWEGDFRRGIRWGIFLFLLASPLLVIGLLPLGTALITLFTTGTISPEGEKAFVAGPFLVLFFVQLVLIPLALLYSLALLVFAPPALLHIARHDRLSAALEIRDWWAIFRARWEDFVLVSLVVLGLIVAFHYLSQALLWITCLLGFFLKAAVQLYVTLVAVYLFAHVYRRGLDAVSSGGEQEQPSPARS